MAIESLIYDLLQHYPHEVSRNAMERWQPRQVLEELLNIDDEVDISRHVTISMNDGRVFDLGEDRRFSARWANKAHNALGSFLHQSTIAQGRSPQDTAKAATTKAEDLIQEIEAVLKSPVSNFRAYRHVGIDCICGFHVARDISFLEAGKEFSCAQCGRIYDYQIQDDKRVRFMPTAGRFKCPSCDEENVAPLHELRPGYSTGCRSCEKTIRFKSGVVIETD